MAKILLPCKLYSDVRTDFICGACYIAWSINRCLKRCVCDWSGWLERFLPNMGSNIISGSVHLLLLHRHIVDLLPLYYCQYVILIILVGLVILDWVHRIHVEAVCRS